MREVKHTYIYYSCKKWNFNILKVDVNFDLETGRACSEGIRYSDKIFQNWLSCDMWVFQILHSHSGETSCISHQWCLDAGNSDQMNMPPPVDQALDGYIVQTLTIWYVWYAISQIYTYITTLSCISPVMSWKSPLGNKMMLCSIRCRKHILQL